MSILECPGSRSLQGAGGDEFLRTMRDLIRGHDPVLIVIVEKRISAEAAERLIRRLRFGQSMRVASGFCGEMIWWKLKGALALSILVSVIIRRQAEEDWNKNLVCLP